MYHNKKNNNNINENFIKLTLLFSHNFNGHKTRHLKYSLNINNTHVQTQKKF